MQKIKSLFSPTGRKEKEHENIGASENARGLEETSSPVIPPEEGIARDISPRPGDKHETSSQGNLEENIQPAKAALHQYYDEHPNKKMPMVTTTTITTHTPTKDVTSTGTINPFAETYTTTTTMKVKKDENECSDQEDTEEERV